MSQDTTDFILKLSAVALALVLLGGGILMGVLILHDRFEDVPPSLTFFMGAAISAVGNLVLGALNRQLANGMRDKLESIERNTPALSDERRRRLESE